MKDTIKKGLAAIVLAAGIAGCSNEMDAVSAAENAGWRYVRVTDSSYFLNFTCEDDEIAYTITGKNPRDEQAQAVVCCGHTTIMKGCTIRHK